MSDSLSGLAAEIEIRQAAHFPIIAVFCRKLSIDRIINRLVPSSMNLDPGTVVVAMIMDTLSGRSPLYRLHEWCRELDTELLFGTEIHPAAFNDDALGRVLDRLYEHGTIKIFTEVSLNACKQYGIKTDRGKFDTTSVNVWGDYADSGAGGKAPQITRDYSQDKRPDLKQFMFSLLCMEGNISLAGKVQDGNAADTRLNNEELQRVSELIKAAGTKRQDILYIADCKLVTQSSLELLGGHPFVTRLPATYNVHREIVDQALAENVLGQINALNQTPQSILRPALQYKIQGRRLDLYGKPYRAFVVYSDGQAKRRIKGIERKLKADKEQALKACDIAGKQTYRCQSDGKAALENQHKQHQGIGFVLVGVELDGTHHAQEPVRSGPHRCIRSRHERRLPSRLCHIRPKSAPPHVRRSSRTALARGHSQYYDAG